MLTGALADAQVARFPSTARRSCARSPIAQRKCNDLKCYSHRGLAHRVIAVGRHARYAAGRRRWRLWGPRRRRLWLPWRQRGAAHYRFKSRVAEEIVAHVYLCVGAVGVFFDFVTTTASSHPVSLSISALQSTRSCSLRRNLIGRAKYTEPD